jgi:hypothetical protein
MQWNLNFTSLAGRTIALPAPKSRGSTIPNRRRVTPLTPTQELERARQAVVRTSFGEGIAWLVLALSAMAVLGLSLWF